MHNILGDLKKSIICVAAGIIMSCIPIGIVKSIGDILLIVGITSTFYKLMGFVSSGKFKSIKEEGIEQLKDALENSTQGINIKSEEGNVKFEFKSDNKENIDFEESIKNGNYKKITFSLNTDKKKEYNKDFD